MTPSYIPRSYIARKRAARETVSGHFVATIKGVPQCPQLVAFAEGGEQNCLVIMKDGMIYKNTVPRKFARVASHKSVLGPIAGRQPSGGFFFSSEQLVRCRFMARS
jgi:hypothetical protein